MLIPSIIYLIAFIFLLFQTIDTNKELEKVRINNDKISWKNITLRIENIEQKELIEKLRVENKFFKERNESYKKELEDK